MRHLRAGENVEIEAIVHRVFSVYSNGTLSLMCGVSEWNVWRFGEVDDAERVITCIVCAARAP